MHTGGRDSVALYLEAASLSTSVHRYGRRVLSDQRGRLFHLLGHTYLI
jgi:hypothetical protein